jgi:hypothetical protein
MCGLRMPKAPIFALFVLASQAACGGDDAPPPGAQPIDGAVLFEDTGSDGAGLPPPFEAGPDAPPPPVDAACAPPRAVPGSSDDCFPVGAGLEQCGDASTSGWLYACPAADASTAPSGATACVDYVSFDFADASWSSTLCTSLACTRATSEDGVGCDGGNAFACPSDALDGGGLAPPSCARSSVGWANGVGMPGSIYCCP